MESEDWEKAFWYLRFDERERLLTKAQFLIDNGYMVGDYIALATTMHRTEVMKILKKESDKV